MMQSQIADSCYFGGNALTCLLDQLVSGLGGEQLFGLLLGSVIFVAFYIGSGGDLATPTVALVLTGTVFIGMLPDSYQQIAYGVVVIGLAAAIWQVLKQYVFSGSVVR
jgi:hypothetical protein